MLTLSLFILILLVFATLLVKFQLSTNSSSELAINQKRIRTWWAIFFICIPIFYVGGWALTFLVYGLIYWSVFEFSRLQNINFNFIRFFLLTVVIISYDIFTNNSPNLINIFLILPIVILGISFFFSTKTGIRTILMLLFCVTSIQTIQLIPQISNKLDYDSGLIILFLFFITAANDIIQYLCGKLLGNKKLTPNLSPNKTIEGALGGTFITGLIFSFTLPNIIDITWLSALLTGVIISIFGILGDLNFSYYKRLAGVKNSGSSMPGHGGLLDRIDSLTLTAPGFGFCLSIMTQEQIKWISG